MVLYAILPPTEESKELARAAALELEGKEPQSFNRDGTTFDVWGLGENGRKLVDTIQSKSRAAEVKNALKEAGVRIPPKSNSNTGTRVVSYKDGHAWNGEDILSLLWPIDEDCKLQIEPRITEDENAEPPKTRKREKHEVTAPLGSLILIFEKVSFDPQPNDRYIMTRFGTSKLPVPAEEA